MKTIRLPLLATLSGVFRSRVALHMEIIALRQQLAMAMWENPKRLRFPRRERLFWVWLYRLWSSCPQALHVFKADTLVRWHRKGFWLSWACKSHRGSRIGLRPIPAKVRALIRRMSQENLGWGCSAHSRRASDAGN